MMRTTYERSGMTIFKEIDGKLVVVANFEQGMDDDMQRLLDNGTINAELLARLELASKYVAKMVADGVETALSPEIALSRITETIRKAKEQSQPKL